MGTASGKGIQIDAKGQSMETKTTRDRRVLQDHHLNVGNEKEGKQGQEGKGECKGIWIDAMGAL